MKIAEAERYIKEKLSGIYEESEARNIASLAMEHITSFSKADRILKTGDPTLLATTGAIEKGPGAFAATRTHTIYHEQGMVLWNGTVC